MLLAKNAYVNSRTKVGWTPLHFVAYKGFNEMINQLVTKHNAAIDATSMVRYRIQETQYLEEPFSPQLLVLFGFT